MGQNPDSREGTREFLPLLILEEEVYGLLLFGSTIILGASGGHSDAMLLLDANYQLFNRDLFSHMDLCSIMDLYFGINGFEANIGSKEAVIASKAANSSGVVNNGSEEDAKYLL